MYVLVCKIDGPICIEENTLFVHVLQKPCMIALLFYLALKIYDKEASALFSHFRDNRHGKV